jgi:hypothetical protein
MVIVKEKITTILNELEHIRDQNNGVLYPDKVVEFAENPDTLLHNKFEWDDGKASHAYRLWQARQVIKLTVVIIPHNNEPIQAYVSLTTNRREEGGYHHITEVLSDKELYQQMLQDALYAYKSLYKKYKNLKELDPIFQAEKEVREKLKII